MASAEANARLDIQTISAGFYAGFSPAVSITSKCLIGMLVGVLVAFPKASSDALLALRNLTLNVFASWYIYLIASFVLLCLLLAIWPASGRITLGTAADRPEYKTASWLSMMFCAGIGVGILAFSVSEPISHFVSNPDIIAGVVARQTPDAMISALKYVFLHWGLSAWGCYAIVGLALSLACHRHGQPLTMRSAVTRIFGKRLEGAMGHTIDVLAVLAIIAGMTTTIVLGLEQICSGLSVLTGNQFFADASGHPPLTALLAALVVAISIAIGSLISGVDRGVKWVSNLGMIVALSVLTTFLSLGPQKVLGATFVHGVSAYIASLPQILTRAYHPGESYTALQQSLWQGSWTIFYWAWWIAFAPFVGLFLARISRGRTVRQFILGAMIAPAAGCFVWFSVIGGSAILLELDGTAQGKIIAASHAFRIYETVDLVLAPDFAETLKAVLIGLFLILIVASSTAAIIAIKTIGAAGSSYGETPAHSIIWAIFIGAIAGATMAIGGVESIRDLMIVAALPFSVVLGLMAIAVAMCVVIDPWRARLEIGARRRGLTAGEHDRRRRSALADKQVSARRK